MRLPLITVLFAGWLAAAAAWAQEDEPYQGTTGESGADVYSGPGRRFYLTDQLPPNSTVEVFRKDGGEWLAIRPPEGSFSWVPSEHLEMTAEPGVAEVIVPETASWIGSRLERVKQHKSHVQLSQGEPVEVLGKKQVEGADGQSQLWLKIAPPAGEFRWVHASQVKRIRAKDKTLTRRGGDLLPVRKSNGSELEPVTDAIVDADEESSNSGPVLPPDAPQPIRNRSAIALRDINEQPSAEESIQPVAYEQPLVEKPRASSDGFVPRKRRPGSPTTPATSRGSLAPLSVASLPRKNRDEEPAESIAPTSRATAASGTLSSEELTRELAELDVELSLMMARDKSTWNLAPLKERAQRLVDGGGTPQERGEARFVLDKIKQIETAFDVDSVASGPTPSPAVSAKTPRFDGEGWLTEVKSSSKPVAPYALVDAEGKRIAFVSPQPGLNLNRYVNKQVGIFGRRGLIPEINAAHLAAQRVVDLDRQLR